MVEVVVMERDEILMALARLQVMQEELLRGFREHKDMQKEMHEKNTERMDVIEADIATMKSNINWAAGFVAAVAIPAGIVLTWLMDWAKQRLGY